MPRKSDPVRTPTAFALSGSALERALVTGENQGLLEDYFGPEAYRQLRDLALHARSTFRGGPRVLILPGIMGSTLAKKSALGRNDVLWLNPFEIALGRLTNLKLGGPSRYFANGVILFAYLKLKLRLQIAGFDAAFFPFDWRQSLTGLGSTLVSAIRAERAAEILLVAHSMGGLVARAALSAAGMEKVRRLIMLGTPNYGSFAAVQALRGTYDVVRKLGMLDLSHNATDLASRVFNTFPGIYELLPSPERFDAINLYDPAAWPSNAPRPRPERLAAVQRVMSKLAPADSRYYLIAGTNQQTAVGTRVQDGEFVYDFSSEGDGTVPLACARLEGIPDGQTYYVEAQHGGLPNHGPVECAVIDLLSTGSTTALPVSPPAVPRVTHTLTESELRAITPAPASGTALYRHLLDSLAAPPEAVPEVVPEQQLSMATAAATLPAEAPLQKVVVGRRRERRLEIVLFNGSITDADSPAYVLGVFRGVAPSGAAKAIDDRLDGAIADFTARRIFSGEVGELFTLPAARARLGADLVVFAGLGPFDRFNPDVHQLVAENIVRMFARSHIDEFATVLIGVGAGQSVPAVVQNLLAGFLRGLQDADPRQRFRGITFCETDPARYAEMKSAILRLAPTGMFDGVEITLDEVVFPPSPGRAAPSAALAGGPEPTYVMIRQESADETSRHFRVSVLGSGMKAAVVTVPQTVEIGKLDMLLRKFDGVAGLKNTWDVTQFGGQFAELMLPQDVRDVLASRPDRHLVLVHDAPASRIPWETIAIGDWSPSIAGGLSRRYLSEDLPITSWLEQRRADPTLNLLLIVDPLDNLPGAAEEGDRIRKLAGAIDGLAVTELRGDRATKPAVLAELRSGRFDIVHFAGHAFFDESAPGRAGLMLAGDNVLSGGDLGGMSNLPFLVFFNACQAGRVRGGARAKVEPGATVRAQHSYSVAETLMRGGISNYLSTYWPVRDDAADAFATAFYQNLLAGNPIGGALLEGRRAVRQTGAPDWADYILYGSYDFILKSRGAQP